MPDDNDYQGYKKDYRLLIGSLKDDIWQYEQAMYAAFLPGNHLNRKDFLQLASQHLNKIQDELNHILEEHNNYTNNYGKRK